MRALPLAIAVVLGFASHARADRLRHPAGFTFELPAIGSWEQDPADKFFTLSVGAGDVPDLYVFAFPIDATDSKFRPLALSLDEAKARLGDELATYDSRIKATMIGITTAKPFKVIDAKAEKIADANALVGHASLHDVKAGFAIVQRGGRTFALVGVPKDGVYERGMANFSSLVHGLQPVPAGAISRDVLPNMPALVAVRDVTATSTFASKHDEYAAWRTLSFAKKLDPDNTIGLVPVTAWCEGKPDEGIGETVTVRLARPTKLDQIRIAAGVWLSQKLFDSNNRPTALDVSLDGKTITAKPPGKREWTTVDVTSPVSTIAIKIAAVKKGKMNDSCLSAIELVREGSAVTPLIGFDADAADQLPGALAKLQKALDGANPARPGLEPLLEFPFTEHDRAFLEGNRKAVVHPNMGSIVKACRAQDKDGDDYSGPPRGCPWPQRVEPTNDAVAEVKVTGTGTVTVVFPGGNETHDVWRLIWRGGGWHLKAIDTELGAAGPP